MNANKGNTDLGKRRSISSKVQRKVNKDMSTDKHCDQRRRAVFNDIKQAMHDLQRKIKTLNKIQRKANKRVKMITTTKRPSYSTMYNNEKQGFLHSNNLVRRKETKRPCIRQRRESTRMLDIVADIPEGKADERGKREDAKQKEETGCTKLSDLPTKNLVKGKGMRLRLTQRRQRNVRVVQANAETREAKMDVNEDKHKNTLMKSAKKQQDATQRCSKCKIFKPAEQFHKNQIRCISCMQLYRQWRQYNKTRTAKQENEDNKQLRKDFFTKRWKEMCLTE